MNIFCGYTPWSVRAMLTFDGLYFTKKEHLQCSKLRELKPDRIFFLHWSWLVPKEITDEFTCIGFHSAPLPKFRGGSPIKNQIKRGIKKTMLTAFEMEEKFDTGRIYLQRPLSLEGDMEQIKRRLEHICPEMIQQIIDGNYKLTPQTGTPTFYTRKDAE